MANYELLVKIGADITDFDKKLGQVKKTMDKTAKNIMSVGTDMTKYLTLPLMAFGGISVKNAAQFEQAMANVGAVSNATASELENLSQIAMTASDSFTPTQTANAMEELIKAGMGLNDIMGKSGLTGTLNLAKAESISLEKAAILTSTALNTFQRDGLDASKAADILVGAANASATSVDQMSSSLQQVSAVASAVGMTFKDTATALAIMAQNGIKSSDAGTSLKTMLARLQPQTDAQVQAFTDLGIITADGTNKFYDSAGSLKDLASISDILQSSLAGMTDQQRQATLQTMFGSDAIRAANVLYKEGKKGVTDMQNAMANIKAQDVAAKKSDTLEGSLTRLKVAYEKLSIEVGKIFTPAVGKAADILTKLADAFTNMTPMQKTFIVTLLSIIGIIGPVIIAFAGLLKAISGVQKVIKNWGSIGTLLTSTTGIVIIAIITLVIILWLLVSNWDEIKAKLKKGIEVVTKFFSDGFNQIKNDIITRAGEISSAFSNWWAWVSNGWTNFWTYMYNGALYYWGLVVAFFTTSIPQWFNNLLAWFASLPGKIGAFLAQLPGIIMFWIGAAAGFLVRTIILMFMNIEWTFTELPKMIGKHLAEFYKTAVDWFERLKYQIGMYAVSMFLKFLIWASQLPDKISNYFSQLYKNVNNWMETVKWRVIQGAADMYWNFINYISQIPSMVSNYFSNMSKNTSAWQSNLASKAAQIGRDMYKGIKDWFDNLPSAIYNALINVGNNISNFKSYLYSRAQQLGDSLWKGFKWGMGMRSPSYIEQAMTNISASIGTSLADATKTIPKFQAALNTLKTPALDIAGANYGTVGVDYGFMSETPLEQNNFNISSLVVREDADIYKIAQELFKLQQANLRANGR